MDRSSRILGALVGILAWTGFASGAAHAQGIPPVEVTAPFAPIASPPITVRVFQGSTDVTATWLPTPGQAVTLKVFAGSVEAPAAIIGLVAPGPANPIAALSLTTSSYPGQCTNFDNPSPLVATSPDFELDPTTKTLTPTDCGGMAVIQISGISGGPFTAILPRDSDFDGMPDIWEAQYCPSGPTQAMCLAATDDTDAGDQPGDGARHPDEYRGYIVSGNHVRTHPQLKDLFVHLAHGQCGSPSLLGRAEGELHAIYPVDEIPSTTLTPSATGGTGVTLTAGAGAFNPSHVGALILEGTTVRATITAFVSATTVTASVSAPFASLSPLAGGTWTIRPALFGNLINLASQTRVHALGYTPGVGPATPQTNEWVDRFFQFTEAGGFLYKPTPDAPPQSTVPADDRQVNKNALYPVNDPVSNLVQRGIRMTECLDESKLTPLGVAGRGSPNRNVETLLYTKRIVNLIDNAIAAGSTTKPLKYSTFVGTSWQTPVTLVEPADPVGNAAAFAAARAFLISRAMQFFAAMEVGHAVRLTSDIQTGKGGANYGYHYAPNTGDNMDQAIETKADTKGNTFWIPSKYNTAGQAGFQTKN